MSSKKYTIGVIPGDGIGQEIIDEGVKVLRAAGDNRGCSFDFVPFDLGAERYLKTGELVPDSVLADLRKLDAIYLGAIGDPRVKPGILEKGILLRIRFELDQYINLRPVKLYEGVGTPLKDKGPREINFVIVRENTEGGYCGMGGVFKKGTSDEVAVQEDINTYKGVHRCIKYAFDYCAIAARKDPSKGKKVTMVDKSNVLTYAHDLWVRVFEQVGREYPSIQTDHYYIDAFCMYMVKNPEWFDVCVTNNMFGDISTDLGAMISGGLGVAAGGNINPNGVSMFEPIHGSAPKYKGKKVINPIATILAGSMMLETLGEFEAAASIERAVQKAITSGRIKDMAAGRMGLSTPEVGDLVASLL